MTIRNSTVPYQGSGDHKDIRIYHGLDDPYGDGHKEGICYINIGPWRRAWIRLCRNGSCVIDSDSCDADELWDGWAVWTSAP